MRLIRFLSEDDRVHFGVPLAPEGEGDAAPDLAGVRSARLVVDPHGVLGPSEVDRAAARRRLLEGKRVILADDDGNMRELMATVLERMGCVCTICTDGAETLRAIEAGGMDLVISDVAMPHYNGYELYGAARKLRSDLPIVLVTGFGYDPAHALVKAEAEGLRRILYKPFTPLRLVEEATAAFLDAAATPADALLATDTILAVERLLAPIAPRDVVCIGANWAATPVAASRSGGAEGRRERDDSDLEVFLKPTASVQDPGGPIVLPRDGGGPPQVVAEGELVAVIGRLCRDVDEDAVDEHLVGWTAALDVTDLRFRTAGGPPLWLRGKGFDTFCPLGPALVTADAFAPETGVRIATRVSGRLRRDGTTAEMRRSVRRIVSALSRSMTLHPGTVVLTGAPPLAGDASDDPLRAGDVVTAEIDGIGVLSCPVRDEA